MIAILLVLLITCACASDSWICEFCNKENYRNFCTECGRARKEATDRDAAACSRGEHKLDSGDVSSVILTCRLCGYQAVNPQLRTNAGGYVTFGRYPQTASGTDHTPIEWEILEYDEKDHKLLLISRYALDCQPYNSRYMNVTWETCSLRKWLNGTFLNKAFTPEEQKVIPEINVDNSRSQGYWNTDGGNDIPNRVFLLSCAEANDYFGVAYNIENVRSRVEPTAYAIQQGAFTRKDRTTEDGKPAGYWWLRSPGNYQKSAALVSADGAFLYDFVYYTYGAVRPALWVNLESEIF